MNGLLNKLLEFFREWLSRRLPDCRSITPTIGESLDRRLNWRERLIMKLHLVTCDKCERYLRHLRFLTCTMRERGEMIADPEAAFGPGLRAESKDRLKELLTRAALSS